MGTEILLYGVMKLKILQGYVKNRTKEAALAVVLLALFFVTRNFKIQITPYFGVDLTSAIVNTAASLLSWSYTIVFSSATLYGGSTVFAVPTWFAGTQAVFFLSKLLGKKWAKYTPAIGEVVGWVAYGLLLQIVGMIDARIFFITTAAGELFYIITAFIGGLLIWKTLRRFKVVD